MVEQRVREYGPKELALNAGVFGSSEVPVITALLDADAVVGSEHRVERRFRLMIPPDVPASSPRFFIGGSNAELISVASPG
jgi:hypothetical protein